MNDGPAVSIVVVTRNAFRFCAILFRSLRKTRGVHYEVVVVDNDSRLPTRLLLLAMSMLGQINRLCLIDRNTLFAEGNNIGVATSDRRSQHVLLLNSDIKIVDPDWLTKLVAVHERGATSLGFVDTGPVPRTDGYCFLIDRDLYLEHGLDEHFQWWWGMTELQAWILRKGHRVAGVADHDELLIHFGGKSGRGHKAASGMDISPEEIQGWFDGHAVERLQRLT